MTEAQARRRRQRSDARQSVAAVLDAAIRVLASRADASMDEVARAAGVSRQTVYAHFPSRDALIDAVIERASAEFTDLLDGLDLDQAPPAQALTRLLDAGWQTAARYPFLWLQPAVDPGKDAERHAPVLDRMLAIVRRGQASGDFDDTVPAHWLLSASLALGRAAEDEVKAGRMTIEQATSAMHQGLLRLLGTDDRGLSAAVPGASLAAMEGVPSAARELDEESADWLSRLGSGERQAAERDLHARLVRIALAEVRRRSASTPVTGPELDDVAHQAAGDAMLAIVAKLGDFRGESRFITWAYRFVVLEVSAKLGRHYWRNPPAVLDAGQWERLPDRFGIDPARHAETADILAEVRRVVDEELTAHQRRVFTAIVVDEIPLDALAFRLGLRRNTVYKVIFDARRKIRRALAANGYLDEPGGERR